MTLVHYRASAPAADPHRVGRQHRTEVIGVNQNNDDRAEAREILDAMHQIQSDPQLASEAITNPESVLDRLALSGAVRHAVAFGLTAVVVGGHLKPGGWWCN